MVNKIVFSLTMIIGISLLSLSTQAAQRDNWLQSLENPRWEIDQLKKDNLKARYSKYDFSTLLMPRNDFLGYIEPDFRRLKIKFTSIKKDPVAQDQYIVTGYSIVKNIKCDFEGVIKLIQVREYKQMHFGVDDEYKDRGIQSQGILLAEYVFNENKEQKFSGIFEGIMTLYWYLEENGHIAYDDIESFADNYKNNQYVGTWTQYNGTKRKVANWGEDRIPFSEDLDIGAAEFSPDPKYYKQGWQDFER
jgi:hypothetical protein